MDVNSGIARFNAKRRRVDMDPSTIAGDQQIALNAFALLWSQKTGFNYANLLAQRYSFPVSGQTVAQAQASIQDKALLPHLYEVYDSYNVSCYVE
jgi:hypothetical protein